jgi:putative acetyltransferase|tara:strand:- start:2657 stop:3169 length:513 start_codon:yes stop_codon:yes gene_type:complete
VIDIRSERSEDVGGIADVVQKAFGGSDEANLVRILRDANKAVVSLVAVDNGRVVGHAMFSEVFIDPPHESFEGVGLAPLSVPAEIKARWVGSKLVREGLNRCALAGYNVAVVLGSTRYYPRFGFSRASDFGLGNEYGEVEHFMAMELIRGALARVSGTVKYQPEFQETNC